ncbi:hypothetical protein PTB13_24775, partial [Bacillus sp. MHSD17]|nr:hypothetical protein [Bacillus sp. MHSD17]
LTERHGYDPTLCQHSCKVVFSVSPCIEQLAFASCSFISFQFLPLKEVFNCVSQYVHISIPLCYKMKSLFCFTRRFFNQPRYNIKIISFNL